MLALLGWNPGTTQEIFALEELIEAFSLERVSKAGAKFDPEKTKWFQQQYLRAQSDATLAEQLRTLQTIEQSDADLQQICALMKERATFAQDILTDGSYLFGRPTAFDAETIRKKWKPETAAYIQEWKSIVNSLTEFSAQTIEVSFKAFLAEKQLGIGAVLLPYRLVLTGVGAGPGMFEISEFLGKEEVLARLDLGLSAVEAILHEA
jgi:glutamyl-tRNA synthetase